MAKWIFLAIYVLVGGYISVTSWFQLRRNAVEFAWGNFRVLTMVFFFWPYYVTAMVFMASKDPERVNKVLDKIGKGELTAKDGNELRKDFYG